MRGMAEFHFHWSIRVYYEDTDAGGVVFYANYLKFFERARTEWLRSLGIDQSLLAKRTGMLFVVRHTAVDYLSPARLDDQLAIRSRIERLGRASVDFLQEAWRGEQLLARGTIKVCCVAASDLKPNAIPPDVLSAMRSATTAEQELTAHFSH
ncbi:MAG: tol-pal system-associated acyl-CoA thioesterase [Burkholderiales bacterium]|nr:tol-pal system-associated acyl-CoA thioesterase [Burkholderiales bacterium]MDE2288169.1 tol-pal system-associated acyl-CoA thioesterase [Burkholderiales bacterium]MDE2611397.1 tol-pal system-associated acyl-CoA thioesterase [Burkholderiales bacterium]